MSDRPKKLIVDCATGAQVEFDLTDEEIAQMAVDAQAAAMEQANRDAEALAQANAKVSAHAKLAKLGLTPEEIAAF